MAKRDGGATRISKGTTEEVPSQEEQQGPRRGWAQGAGGQGSRWQDTEPSRQRQRLQGSPGGKKCSWLRAGTASPDRGQPAGTSARECVTWHEGAGGTAGRGCLGSVAYLPRHCGQHSPGGRTGSGQDSGGQRRARHCTLPL